MNAEFWDERYSADEYVYGETPNKFLAEKLVGLTTGKILFPADGEGRNSVYAATLGWETYAFDQSQEGKRKAEQLAARKNVNIRYAVVQMPTVDYQPASFDAIALIFAHFPAREKLDYLQQLGTYLKPGGIIIFEAYSKNHLRYKAENPKVGGPGDEAMLYTTEEILNCFPGYEILQLAETELEIWEGKLHGGMSSVIRFVGRKK